MSSLDVKTSLDGLAVLARQGSWRAIVDKVVEGYKLAGLAQQLALRGYHVLALMKLRMYGAAAEELMLLGNLDSPQYRYEAHPGMYPGRKGEHPDVTWLPCPGAAGADEAAHPGMYLCGRKGG
ncbi:unnamed protein product [Closterium sp. Yama58-4]|nr:unnamed protein product [Closterium sp. Yama58-4]